MYIIVIVIYMHLYTSIYMCVRRLSAPASWEYPASNTNSTHAACMYACSQYVSMQVCTTLCVGMHVCMHVGVCKYVCMYVHISV